MHPPPSLRPRRTWARRTSRAFHFGFMDGEQLRFDGFDFGGMFWLLVPDTWSTRPLSCWWTSLLLSRSTSVGVSTSENKHVQFVSIVVVSLCGFLGQLVAPNHRTSNHNSSSSLLLVDSLVSGARNTLVDIRGARLRALCDS